MPGIDDDWLVRPGLGLGRLIFGASPQEVEALSDVYEPIARRAADRIPDAILHDTLAELGGDLSEDERREILALYADLGPAESSATEIRGGLSLRFEHDRLVEILITTDHVATTLDDVALFSIPVEVVLAAAEALNGAPGLHASTTAIFPKLGLVFEGFSQQRDETVLPLDANDERFTARSLMLFETLPPDLMGAPFSWR